MMLSESNSADAFAAMTFCIPGFEDVVRAHGQEALRRDLDKGRRFAGQEFLPPPDEDKDLPPWKKAVHAVF